MKIIICCLSLLFFNGLYAQDKPNDICGIWLSAGEKGQGLVEIYQAPNGKFYGRLIKALDESKQQRLKQELEAVQKEELLVLQDFEATTTGVWKNGQVLSPHRKQLFDGELRLISADTLEVTGKWGFYSKLLIWTRE